MWGCVCEMVLFRMKERTTGERGMGIARQEYVDKCRHIPHKRRLFVLF
mgnify:CR=1 FL=1